MGKIGSKAAKRYSPHLRTSPPRTPYPAFLAELLAFFRHLAKLALYPTTFCAAHRRHMALGTENERHRKLFCHLFVECRLRFWPQYLKLVGQSSVMLE